MELSRAVAASACVPMVFEPMRLRQYYRDIEVSLVDGGVFDNQGTVALLGSDCHVVLVSDACGQLMLERMPPTGVTAAVLSAKRSMDTLMERVRLANFSHLAARRRSGLLRGLMSLHMKAGLNGPVIRLGDTTETYDLEVTQLSPLGLGKPAFQPYWGKPAVRNDREDRGNVGIIRSPIRASILPDSDYRPCSELIRSPRRRGRAAAAGR
jgi:hypothetical protein